jgi:galactose mutarotase-like enzyme
MPNLGNVGRDGNQKPIHGVLGFSKAWKLVEAKADGTGAWAASRLEFWRHPEMMAQFPFPHTLTMTYRLRDGSVEVETAIENHGTDPMPVAVGFHPYFQLHDVHRDEWHVHLAARDHLVLNAQLIPTGERKPVEFADPHSLSAGPLDDVFANLIRDPDGRARFNGGRRAGAHHGGLRTEVHRRGGLRAEGPGLHLLRADGGDYQRFQPGARRGVPGVAERGAGRDVERELLAERGVSNNKENGHR